MILWTALNSGAIVLLMLALYLTIRQVGLLLSHLGPGGARPSDLGPRVGENISAHAAPLLGGALPRQERVLFLFATEYCPACATLREAMQLLARHWAPSARLIMVYDSLSDGRNGAAGGAANFAVTAQPALRQKLNIHAVPYAVVTDGDGLVLGHGLVNSASHVESLLEVKAGPAASAGPGAPSPGSVPSFPEG